ncbi:MAG: flagellar hook-associated protein FlgL [Clostridia bacterium]|nr:flagellar hook-associated protein FlgL [Clostridia bacterium]
MRITNKMMTNTSQVNINTNKTLLDKLNTQVSTQKKISRPSDDPVIAIRALRLRSNLNEISQYYKKNIPDADSWLNVTESALKTTEGVLEDMYDYCVQGSNGDITASDRLKLLENLKELKNQVYSTGNSDYAGRTVFTGYRTGMPLMFKDSAQNLYSITEPLTKDSIETIKYVSGTVQVDKNNPVTTSENGVQSNNVSRIRLAYDNLDASNSKGTTSISLLDANKAVVGTITPVIKELTGDPAVDDTYYTGVGPDECYLIADTGELILGDNIKAQMQDPDVASINVTYEKDNWKKDDLYPEHYFNCKDYGSATSPKNPPIDHQYTPEQIIEYDVSFNQKLRVNTLASEVYLHDVVRDVDELIEATQKVIDCEGRISTLKKMQKDSSYTEAQQKAISTMITAAEKEYTYLKENMKNDFGGEITKTQNYMDRTNLAIANCGARGTRLELTETRMKEQQTNYTELASKNENVDVTEVAIELASAELAYDAALLATGKISQQSLLNYL